MTGTAATPGIDFAYRALLERLRSGEFRAGKKLPGERSLAADVGVSRASLRGALAILADENLVAPHQKRGWFVREERVGEPPNTLLSFTEMAAVRGVEAHARIVEFRARESAAEEATALAIAPAQQVFEILRVRSMEASPICVERTLIPVHLAPELAQLDLTDRSLFETMGSFGVVADRSSYVVSAELMDDTNAALLEVDAGSPALIAEEVVFSAAGIPMMKSELTYRGSAYRFSATLYR